MRRMGPLFTLQEQAIAIERKRKRFDDALRRIDLLLAQAQRKEVWLVEKGAILAEAGRAQEAAQAYAAARAAIAALPAQLRANKATQELETMVRLQAPDRAPPHSP